MRHVVFILFYPNEQRAGGGGGVLPDFSFPCSADHEWDWPPCKVVFRVGNQYAECEKQYTVVYCILYTVLVFQNENFLFPAAWDAK